MNNLCHVPTNCKYAKTALQRIDLRKVNRNHGPNLGSLKISGYAQIFKSNKGSKAAKLEVRKMIGAFKTNPKKYREIQSRNRTSLVQLSDFCVTLFDDNSYKTKKIQDHSIGKQ